MRCFGSNQSGQAGVRKEVPAVDFKVDAQTHTLPKRIKKMVLGARHTCALLTNDALYCWGRNVEGQAGVWGVSDFSEPSEARVLKDGDGGIRDVAAAKDTTCVVLETGKVRCFGSVADEVSLFLDAKPDWCGESACNVGTDKARASEGPEFLDEVVGMDMSNAHRCVNFANGNVRCWGHSHLGALGTSFETEGTYLGEVLASDPPVNALSLASHSSCAVDDLEQVFCWGRNDFGQGGTMGDAALSFEPTRHLVFTLAGDQPRQIASGAYHRCALLQNGEVHCWGRAESGQLGLGSRAFVNAPIEGKVSLGGTAISLSASFESTCVILYGNRVNELLCWGANGTLDGTDLANLGYHCEEEDCFIGNDMGEEAASGLRIPIDEFF